jgi:ergothioneine biosynthesis protein EgtB
MHMFSFNPMLPAYRPGKPDPAPEPPPMRFVDVDDGVHEIGHIGDGFAYDNETPRHKVYLDACRIADRLVTNGEFMRFIDDGGYANAVLWLDLARPTVEREQWCHPLYWFERDGQWFEFCVNGAQPLDPNAPLRHISYFEADAYARWTGKRLPTEFEWEAACANEPLDGTCSDALRFHPAPARRDHERPLQQVFGELWQWTRSQYVAYPGFTPPEGALGEYNGKFMCNQFVLRGGSVATPRSHLRATYRNFFPPESRWQFSGIRLAEDNR